MPRMNSRFVVAGLSLVVALFAVACVDPKCPKGYDQKGDTCYRIRDAGPEADGGKSIDAGPGADGGENSGEVYDGRSELEGSEDDAGPETSAPMDAGSDATDAPVDPCDPNPCEHGGQCSRNVEEPLCDCAGTGFEGTTCERDIDECAAPNSCTSPDCPCVQTEPPGYTCLGQFADWPMPDAVSGAKVKPSYAVTADTDVVIDQVTGLVWQRHLPAVYAGCTAGAVTGSSCRWHEAVNYCRNRVLGGFDDWRLPSKIELESIVNDTRLSPPAVDAVVFPDVPAGASDAFWSSSRSVSTNQEVALTVLSNGGTFPAPVDAVSNEGLQVRCVRGPRVASGTPGERYRFNEQGVASATDTRTGLTWQRNIDANSYARSGAIVYCSGLGAGWRLPTKKELLTLIDSVRLSEATVVNVDSAIDLDVFPSTPARVELWSISPKAIQEQGEPRYWLVHTSGIPVAASDTKLGRVRCVR